MDENFTLKGNDSLVKIFGQCYHDYYTFVSLLIAMVAMTFGNGLLLYSALKTFQASRTDMVVLNQAVVDVAYCILFPFVILDSRREIQNRNIFTACKIVEDSLLTMSILAVLIVNIHKYFYIKSAYIYLTTVSSNMTKILIVGSWILTPVGFTIRNLHFTCRRNRPCGSSYLFCLAASGAGEISSIIFYVSSTLVIIVLNVRLLALATQFQNELRFSRSGDGTTGEGRKIFSRPVAVRRQRHLKIVLYPLVSSFLVLATISPFWITMAICQLKIICLDDDHSLFYLMRLHSMFNPYCTLMTHRKYRRVAWKALQAAFNVRKPFSPSRSENHVRTIRISSKHLINVNRLETPRASSAC